MAICSNPLFKNLGADRNGFPKTNSLRWHLEPEAHPILLPSALSAPELPCSLHPAVPVLPSDSAARNGRAPAAGLVPSLDPKAVAGPVEAAGSLRHGHPGHPGHLGLEAALHLEANLELWPTPIGGSGGRARDPPPWSPTASPFAPHSGAATSSSYLKLAEWDQAGSSSAAWRIMDLSNSVYVSYIYIYPWTSDDSFSTPFSSWLIFPQDD